MLDRKRPYSQIYGDTADGAVFKQDGIRYLPSGKPCDGQKAPEPPVTPPVAPETPVVEAAPEVPTPAEEPEAPAPEPEAEAPAAATEEGGETDYENMHHMILKKKVKEAGGDYIDRDQAIAFLKSLEEG